MKQGTSKPLRYDPPQGPQNHMHEGPGLGGSTNHGNTGSQGHHGGKESESGRPGLGGQKLQHGSEHGS